MSHKLNEVIWKGKQLVSQCWLRAKPNEPFSVEALSQVSIDSNASVHHARKWDRSDHDSASPPIRAMYVCDPIVPLQSPDIAFAALGTRSVVIRKGGLSCFKSCLGTFCWGPTLNSCSRKLSRRSSHESSNAVKIGSFDDRAIKLGLANAR